MHNQFNNEMSFGMNIVAPALLAIGTRIAAGRQLS